MFKEPSNSYCMEERPSSQESMFEDVYYVLCILKKRYFSIEVCFLDMTQNFGIPQKMFERSQNFIMIKELEENRCVLHRQLVSYLKNTLLNRQLR